MGVLIYFTIISLITVQARTLLLTSINFNLNKDS